jgi:hypothetical protein
MSSDWFPGAAIDQLVLCGTWIHVSTENKVLWGIADTSLAELGARRDAARSAQAVEENESTRTPVTVAECRAAFRAQKEFMRDFKRRYFISPPLTDADFVALGLKPRAKHRTPVSAPEDIPDVEVQTPHPRTVRIRFRYRNAARWGKPKNVRGIECQWIIAGSPPLSVDDLLHTATATRNPLELVFEENQRGKKIYFAVRWEAGATKKGKWSDIFYVIIP